MTLMRRDPNNLFETVDQTMNRMLERMRAMMNGTLALLPYDAAPTPQSGANLLAVDMTSDDKHIIIRTELPGFRQDEIDVSVRGNVLTISAESRTERKEEQSNWYVRELRYGRFTRSLTLPEEVFSDKAEATLENGILTVKLPKQKPNPIQQIAVRVKNLLTSGQK